MRTEILFSAPLITRSLVHLDQAACPVWDRKLVKAAVFHHVSQMDAGGTNLLGSPLANFHLRPRIGEPRTLRGGSGPYV